MQQISQSAQPMPFWQSSLLFTIPGIIFALFYIYVFDYLISTGTSQTDAMVLVSSVLLSMLLALALMLYRREGNLFTWNSFKTRMRLKKMDRQAWIYTVWGSLFGIGTYVGLLFTGQYFASTFELPTWAMQPKEAEPLIGAYSLILIRFGLLLLNVFSEELLWRGVILPRQELEHSKHAWWIHGLQWTWFHLMFKPWEIFMLLPGCLIYGWVCSRTQNTTPGIIMHLSLNGLGVIMVSLAVFGLI